MLSGGSYLMTRDPRFQISKADYTLILRDIKPQDAGDFVCQINLSSEVMELAHTVEVLGEKTE